MVLPYFAPQKLGVWTVFLNGGARSVGFGLGVWGLGFRVGVNGTIMEEQTDKKDGKLNGNCGHIQILGNHKLESHNMAI